MSHSYKINQVFATFTVDWQDGAMKLEYTPSSQIFQPRPSLRDVFHPNFLLTEDIWMIDTSSNSCYYKLVHSKRKFGNIFIKSEIFKFQLPPPPLFSMLVVFSNVVGINKFFETMKRSKLEILWRILSWSFRMINVPSLKMAFY